MKIPGSCLKWSTGFFIASKEKKTKTKVLRNMGLGLGKLKHWFSKHHETSLFMWLWLTGLQHQLPLSTDGMGTQLERSISCWEWGWEVAESQKGAQFKNKLESSSSMALSLFEHTSNMHYVAVPMFAPFQNQTMIFTCYPEDWKQ